MTFVACCAQIIVLFFSIALVRTEPNIRHYPGIRSVGQHEEWVFASHPCAVARVGNSVSCLRSAEHFWMFHSRTYRAVRYSIVSPCSEYKLFRFFCFFCSTQHPTCVLRNLYYPSVQYEEWVFESHSRASIRHMHTSLQQCCKATGAYRIYIV